MKKYLKKVTFTSFEFENDLVANFHYYIKFQNNRRCALFGTVKYLIAKYLIPMSLSGYVLLSINIIQNMIH